MVEFGGLSTLKEAHDHERPLTAAVAVSLLLKEFILNSLSRFPTPDFR